MKGFDTIARITADRAQNAYAMGAKVSHNGKHWISDYDANIWEPGVVLQAWHEA